MQETAAQRNTRLYYEWVARGNGWQTYNAPVQLEPPLEPFDFDTKPTEPFVDDGLRPTLFGLLKKEIGKAFQKPQVKPEEEKRHYSYPDRPVPFRNNAALYGFRVSLPKKEEVHIDEAERLLHMLSFTASHLSFEIFGTSEAVHIQWTCREQDKDRLVSQLQSYFPLLAIVEFDPTNLPFQPNAPIAVVDLALEQEFILPLKGASTLSLDPFIGIIAALESLQYGETGWVQVLFQGTQGAWAGPVNAIVSDGQGGSFFMDAPEMPKLAAEKTASPLYGVAVRVISQGYTESRTREIGNGLIQSLIASSRSEYNSLVALPGADFSFDLLIQSMIERTSHRLGMLLNSKELVNLVHIPSASVASPKLSRQAIKTKLLPRALTNGSYGIGYNFHMGSEQIAWITDEHRLKHMHVIGVTGTGKSTLLSNLFLQDCDAGNGCIVFDPHGDLIDDLIPQIDEERLSDVILIDPSDTEYPIGFNLLEAKTDLEKTILSSDLVETFKANSIVWGDTINAVLIQAINAFLDSSRGGTLLELRKFLLDAKFRYSILSTVEDPAIRSYWQHEFPQLKKGSLSPLLTRIDIFLRPKIVRNMMAQKDGLDFKKVLAENKIVLVKLSQGLIGKENSYILGTLLLAKVYQAAQARQSLSKTERTAYYVYLDEFHNFITPSLAEILSGARKYGLGLILAHQELSQIQDTEIGNSVLSNPAIRVCFRVGHSDAQKLEKGFGYFASNDLQNLSTGEAIVRVERSDWDFNIHTGEPSTEKVVNNNLEVIREQTRASYATPIKEIEAIVNELYQFEPAPPKPKERTEIKPVEPKREPKPILPEGPKIITPIPAIEQPKTDIEEAAKKFIESTEKQREKREHLYMQDFVKKMAEQRGFKAQLEAPTPDGGRIDILLTRNELTIACELSVTNTIEYEVKNLQKCMDAGYKNIVILCSNETHLRNIRQAANQLPNDEDIQFLNPEHLYKYLDTFIIKTATKESRVRGYRIKTSYGPPEDKPIS